MSTIRTRNAMGDGGLGTVLCNLHGNYNKRVSRGRFALRELSGSSHMAVTTFGEMFDLSHRENRGVPADNRLPGAMGWRIITVLFL